LHTYASTFPLRSATNVRATNFSKALEDNFSLYDIFITCGCTTCTAKGLFMQTYLKKAE